MLKLNLASQVIRTVAKPRFMSSVAPSLSKLLAEEIAHEKSLEPQPLDFLTEFKSKGIWTIKDTEGSKEVTLTRDFNNEKISVIFSTDSLQEMDEEPLEEDEMSETPIGVSILIEKPGKAALEITASTQDSSFFIDNVALLKDAKLAQNDTAEGDWQRRGLYTGPVFADMDENLIDVFHQFIIERGLDEELAEFIPSYAVYKEQQEYVKWLQNMADFVN